MRSNYKRLGDYIRQVNERNANISVTDLQGINIAKEFMPSVANVIGTDLTTYKIVRKRQFAFNPMHVGRDGVLPINVLLNEDRIIVSPAYTVFEIIDENELNAEYLMMWFRRSEFDRNAWFTTDSSVRGGFGWTDFCDMKLPIPSIDKQKEIIKEYNTLANRITLNNQLNQKLEETAQTIYKQWFVDFEFPDENGKPYKSNGGEMIESEMGEIPKGWKVGTMEKAATQFSGYAFIGEEYSFLEGITVLRGENVTEKKLRWDTHKKWNNPIDKKIEKCFLNENDIVIGMDGSKVGKNWAIISKYDLPLLLAQRVSCLRSKNPAWQFYIYNSMSVLDFVQYVSQVQTGTSIPHISGQQILNFPILFPMAKQLNKYNSLIKELMNHQMIIQQQVLKLDDLLGILLIKVTS